MIVALRKHPDRDPYVEIGFRRFCSSGWAVGIDFAARLLAGLEVALAAALREAGRGKCLRCGLEIVWDDPAESWVHCLCGGILSPLPAREGEP